MAAAQAQDAPFSLTTPMSSNAELMRRLYSPLRAEQIRGALARGGQALGEQSVDLSQESFLFSVPARKPDKGYGLVVFVPPWNEAVEPRGWKEVLDAKGFIFVSAGHSGNTQDVAARREPLALLAWANIAARYQLDPSRVYIAGLSGGSRVALRLALGYPDVFAGALLNAGSDPIGSPEIPLPPRDLFARFQTATRLVYLTGGLDREHLDMDKKSQASMRDWCVANITGIIVPGLKHETADADSLAKALGALDVPAASDPSLAQCRAGLGRTLAAKLDEVKALEASGRRDEALSRLKEIDARYGGLAAPESVALSR
ncbi:MAG TPA: PHB depolymerase family esterase [Rhizomicrobium sp.]